MHACRSVALDLGWFLKISNGSQICLAGQEPILFSTCIIENVMVGKENETKEEALAAAGTKTNAHTFVLGLPDNYDMQVSRTKFWWPSITFCFL